METGPETSQRELDRFVENEVDFWVEQKNILQVAATLAEEFDEE
jgi:hypothetical protein